MHPIPKWGSWALMGKNKKYKKIVGKEVAQLTIVLWCPNNLVLNNLVPDKWVSDNLVRRQFGTKNEKGWDWLLSLFSVSFLNNTFKKKKISQQDFSFYFVNKKINKYKFFGKINCYGTELSRTQFLGTELF